MQMSALSARPSSQSAWLGIAAAWRWVHQRVYCMMSWNDRYRLQLDLQTILTQPPLPTYMRTSAMVRLGERRILHLASRVIDTRRHTGVHPSDLPVAKRKFDAGDNENKGRNATAGILFRDRP